MIKKTLIFISFLIIAVLIISCEREVSHSPVESFQPLTGKIIIETIPSGFNIFDNGRNTGQKTPDSLKWLEDGTHYIQLTREGFIDKNFGIFINNGSTYYINMNYWNYPTSFADLNIFSDPNNANLFLNDSSLDKTTPAKLRRLYPGTYKVRGELPNHRHDEVTFKLVSSQFKELQLTLIDTSLWVTYNAANSNLTNNYISALDVSNPAEKYLGTTNGFSVLDGSGFRNYTTDNSALRSNTINFIKYGPDKKAWIGTMNGLYQYENGNFTTYIRDNSGLLDNGIFALEFDVNGTAWLGTIRGLTKFDGSSWYTYNVQNSNISANVVRTICLDNDGNIWAGTSSFGLNKFDGVEWTTYRITELDSLGETITAGAFDHDNIGWFAILQQLKKGNRGGLLRYDGASFVEIPLSTSVEIRDIYVDYQNNKWISTNFGLEMITNSGEHFVFSQYQTGPYTGIDNQMGFNRLNIARIDPNDNLWVGTAGGGLIKLKRNKIK